MDEQNEEKKSKNNQDKEHLPVTEKNEPSQEKEEKIIEKSESDVTSEPTDTSSEIEENQIPEPKKIERKIKHPKTDVVRYDDPDLDANWGWAIEFPTSEHLTPIWENLKNFLENNPHPIKGKVSWLSLDPRGYFSPRLRHFISFTGWGVTIEQLPNWFKQISELPKPIKAIEPSEELADGNWQGYIVKEKIDLIGSEFVKLEKFTRNKRKTVEEPKKPISSNLPRYWTQKSLYTAKDYLVPVITDEKYKVGELSAISYLEEYIVEQLEWSEPSNKEEFVILPSEFTFDENAKRKISIPEEYTPEIQFDYPGMFPGMGGLGGMGGMDGMPDFGDMPDLDDSELEDADSDDEGNSESDETDDTMDAEVISEDK